MYSHERKMARNSVIIIVNPNSDFTDRSIPPVTETCTINLYNLLVTVLRKQNDNVNERKITRCS